MATPKQNPQKTKNRMTPEQRARRFQQIVFVVMSIIIILSFLVSLVN